MGKRTLSDNELPRSAWVPPNLSIEKTRRIEAQHNEYVLRHHDVHSRAIQCDYIVTNDFWLSPR
jgi:hypothetical protein